MKLFRKIITPFLIGIIAGAISIMSGYCIIDWEYYVIVLITIALAWGTVPLHNYINNI
jgi:hypothetical protein